MTVLLLFILAAQGSAAIVMPGDAQVARGPASGRLLVGCPPDSLVVTRTPVTQRVNLSPDPTRIVVWDQKEVPGAFGDLSERAFPIHTEGPRLIMRIALECLEGAALKFPLGGDECQARAQLECSSVCNLLDAYMMLPRVSQGANVSEIEARKARTQVQLSNQRRLLVRVGSTADKTTVLARGVGSAFAMHLHGKKRETGRLHSFPRVTVQDIYSPKPFPKVGYWLGNNNVKSDPPPLLTSHETGILQRWPPETNVPRTVRRTYHLCLCRPWFQDAIQRHGARIQNARSQLAQSTRRRNGPLLSLLGNCSVESSLPSSVNPVTARPAGSSVPKPVLYKKPLYPESSERRAKPLYLFCGHRPYVKQLFYSILKNQKGGGNRLVQDKYESRVVHHGLLDNPPRPFYAILSFSLVIIFVWAMGQLFQSLRIGNRWPERLHFEDEVIREFRRGGERVVRHLYHNVLEPF